MVESLDQVADTLLMLQPENVEYEARFETEDISLVVVKPISSENVQIESGNIVVHIPTMTSAERTQNIMGVKVSHSHPSSIIQRMCINFVTMHISY